MCQEVRRERITRFVGVIGGLALRTEAEEGAGGDFAAEDPWSLMIKRPSMRRRLGVRGDPAGCASARTPHGGGDAEGAQAGGGGGRVAPRACVGRSGLLLMATHFEVCAVFFLTTYLADVLARLGDGAVGVGDVRVALAHCQM